MTWRLFDEVSGAVRRAISLVVKDDHGCGALRQGEGTSKRRSNKSRGITLTWKTKCLSTTILLYYAVGSVDTHLKVKAFGQAVLRRCAGTALGKLSS